MECVFCNKKIIDAEKFYEDEYYYAAYNLRAFLPGHSLVIPKRHVENLTELNKGEKEDLVSFLNRTIFIALKFAETEDYDLVLQQGESAGRSIAHLHFHVIPRKETDKANKSKAEWLSEFNKNEVYGRNLTEAEMKSAVEKAEGIAKRYSSELKALS